MARPTTGLRPIAGEVGAGEAFLLPFCFCCKRFFKQSMELFYIIDYSILTGMTGHITGKRVYQIRMVLNDANFEIRRHFSRR